MNMNVNSNSSARKSSQDSVVRPLENAMTELGKAVLDSRMKPTTKALVGIGALVGIYAVNRFLPGFLSNASRAALQAAYQARENFVVKLEKTVAQIATHPSTPYKKAHPEAAEPITTRINERQLGRSEVIREISRGRMN